MTRHVLSKLLPVFWSGLGTVVEHGRSMRALLSHTFELRSSITLCCTKTVPKPPPLTRLKLPLSEKQIP